MDRRYGIFQIAGRESISILIGPADNLSRVFNGQTGGIDYIEAQFTSIGLAKQWYGRKEDEGCESLHCESPPWNLMVNP